MSEGDAPIVFPRLNGLKQAHPTNTPHCHNCVFYQINAQNMSMGFCHGNPPATHIVGNQLMVMRPQVSGTDRGCRHLIVSPQ